MYCVFCIEGVCWGAFPFSYIGRLEAADLYIAADTARVHPFTGDK